MKYKSNFSKRLIKAFSFVDNFTKKVTVYYRDEDGEDTAKFDTRKEADEWVRMMNAKTSSGEKFYHIRTEEVNFTKESEELKKHQKQYGPKSGLSGRELINRNNLLEDAAIKRYNIENTVATMTE